MTDFTTLNDTELSNLDDSGLADVQEQAKFNGDIIQNSPVISAGHDSYMRRLRTLQYAAEKEIAHRADTKTQVDIQKDLGDMIMGLPNMLEQQRKYSTTQTGETDNEA